MLSRFIDRVLPAWISSRARLSSGGGVIGPPAGYRFVTTINGAGDRIVVTTVDQHGESIPVITRTS